MDDHYNLSFWPLDVSRLLLFRLQTSHRMASMVGQFFCFAEFLVKPSVLGIFGCTRYASNNSSLCQFTFVVYKWVPRKFTSVSKVLNTLWVALTSSLDATKHDIWHELSFHNQPQGASFTIVVQCVPSAIFCTCHLIDTKVTYFSARQNWLGTQIVRWKHEEWTIQYYNPLSRMLADASHDLDSRLV